MRSNPTLWCGVIAASLFLVAALSACINACVTLALLVIAMGLT